jgi:hypothetical protein
MLLDEAQGGEGGRDPDRQVHEEDPVPVDRLGERPTHQETDRAARDCDERVDPDRLRLVARLGEHRDDHAEDHGGGKRPADPLDEACADEQPLALRERAGERRGGEHGQASEENSSPADQVAEAAREQQQPTERDQVGVHHPRQVALREAEVVLDRGQRDVHDRRVEDDHEHPQAKHVQGHPALAVVGHFDRT